MKLSKIFQKMCVGVATVGLLVPQAGIVRGAEQVVAAKQSKVKIVDVSLADGGVLKGQVISPQGKAIAQTPVSLHQGKSVVAKTTTNAAGEFSFSGVKSGAYAISTDGAAGVVRAWSGRTAPPSAVAGVLLVPQKSTTLGQDTEEEETYIEEEVGGGTNLGLGAVIVGGVLATVIAVSLDHNSAS